MSEEKTSTENDEQDPSAASPTAPNSDMPAASSSEETPSAADRPDEESTTSAAAQRPSARIQIGSQRIDRPASEEKAKPTVPEIKLDTREQERTKRYPPPNTRDALSPELEAEYLMAVGDQSLDELMDIGKDAPIGAELARDTRVKGRVARIFREDVFIDLAGSNQGVVSARQFEELPAVGDELELLVSKRNVEDGLYELTRPTAAVDIGNWDDVEEGQIVEVTVTGSNKGGLECQVSGLRGFMPMGQISMYRVETPEDYVGQRLLCLITEANPDRRNLVLSHRAVMERERAEKREKLLEELAPGQIRQGVVRSLRDFGAFVDLGGVDGLVHVSQLSWDRIHHPSEVLSEGQTIKVKVEKVDRESGRIGLSYRDVGANPWDDVETKYPLGKRIMGTVSKVMDFGAFVKMEPGVEGLVHISELVHGRVFRTSDVVCEGQELEVQVLAVDREKQRISLSLKALLPPPSKQQAEQPEDEDLGPSPDAPKAPSKKHKQLKGGVGKPTGGEQFGLKW